MLKDIFEVIAYKLIISSAGEIAFPQSRISLQAPNELDYAIILDIIQLLVGGAIASMWWKYNLNVIQICTFELLSFSGHC